MKKQKSSELSAIPQSESNSHSQSHSLSDTHPLQNDALHTPLLPSAGTTSADVYHDAGGAAAEGENAAFGGGEGGAGEGQEAEDEEYEEELEEEDEDCDDVEEREGEPVEEMVGEVATSAEQRAVKRQKLADGFYEVEVIRKKRICKGEPQYLIKWRGWPESANTWEPIDHLQTCPDIVEAFEQSLQKKGSRKRKRKFTQPKKKMQYPYGVSKSKISPIKMILSSEPHPDVQSGMVEVVVEHDEGMKIFGATNIADCNGSKTGPLHLSSDDKNHDVHFQHVPVEVDGPTNCQPKASCIEDVMRRGAKRRKSGSVRRFTQEMTSFNLDCSGNAVPVSISTCDGVGQLMLANSDAYRKKKCDSFRSSITKLIKPISYSASVTNNIQDVSVIFVAMRSDGKEVMVDNKFLKANNPLLLINFYEQHLRYNPS